MPIRITHRKQEEVPTPSPTGKVNADIETIKAEMARLASGMVLEIEIGSEKAIRGTKMLVTKASNQLGTPWRHWHVGTKVYAKPIEATNKRRQRSARANLHDYRN